MSSYYDFLVHHELLANLTNMHKPPYRVTHICQLSPAIEQEPILPPPIRFQWQDTPKKAIGLPYR